MNKKSITPKRRYPIPLGWGEGHFPNLMLLNDNLPKYKQEIFQLYKEYLHENPKGHTFFGIVKNDELQAVASVRCYHGHWYLRGCVVKPEFRGQGLQKKLIHERLEYLTNMTDVVKVSVYVDNPKKKYSIDNILAEDFVFEKNNKLDNGRTVHVYKRELSSM
jgi:GNAT superfamily N-acetyltransferase